MILKRFICICLPLATTLLIFASCGGGFKFKNDGNTGNLIDEANGRYYIYCRGYLQAAEIKKSVYAKGDQKEMLHEISGIDPAEWLSEDISKGVAFLFREQSVEEPTLEGFETEAIHIAVSGEMNVEILTITDKSEIDTIVGDFLNNAEAAVPDFVVENFTLYFESEKYKGIYYVLQYYADDKGKGYLYDRWTERCVPCSLNIFG